MAAGLVGENRSLHEPLPGSLQVKLKAGDLAVYLSPTILHWGSSYNRLPLRRTLHGGYSTQHGACLGPEIWPQLQPSSVAAFQRWQNRAEAFGVRSADAISAVAAGDLDRFVRAASSGYGAGPIGPHGLRLQLINLAQTAKDLMDTLERDGAVAGWGDQDVRALWARLRVVHEAMQGATLSWEPGAILPHFQL